MTKSWMIKHIKIQRELCLEAIKKGDFQEAIERDQEQHNFEETCKLRMLEELKKGDVWIAAEYCLT